MPDVLQPRKQEEQNIAINGLVDIPAQDRSATIFKSEEVPFLNIIKLQQFFGIGNPSSKDSELLNNLYSHFDQSGSRSMNEMMMELNNIEMKLGSLPLGMNRLQRLWNYVKLISEMTDIKKLKKSYERSTNG